LESDKTRTTAVFTSEICYTYSERAVAPEVIC